MKFRLLLVTGLLSGTIYANVPDPNIGLRFAVEPQAGPPGSYVRLKCILDLDLDGAARPIIGWSYSVCLDEGLTLVGDDALPVYVHHDPDAPAPPRTDYRFIYFPGADSEAFDDIEDALKAERDSKCTTFLGVGTFGLDPDDGSEVRGLRNVDPANLVGTALQDEWERDVYMDTTTGDHMVRATQVEPYDLKDVLGPLVSYNFRLCAGFPTDPCCQDPDARAGLPLFYSVYTVYDSPPGLLRAAVVDVLRTVPGRNDILDADLPVLLGQNLGTYGVRACGPNVGDGLPEDFSEFIITSVAQVGGEPVLTVYEPLPENLGTGSVDVMNFPRADFTASPTEGYSPLDVAFTNASSGGGDPGATLSWEFGDGNTSSEEDPVHTYEVSSPGGMAYTVRLTARNGAGEDTKEVPDMIRVFLAPDADFNTTARGLTVDFLNASGGDVSSYLWQFGDGDTSGETNPTHTYDAAGTYLVRLTATGPLPGDPQNESLVEKSIQVSQEIFLRGDLDNNGRRNLADVIYVLINIFRPGGEFPCPDAADVDDNGKVALGDVILLLQFIFTQPPPVLPPPSDAPGVDPTSDQLPPCRLGG